MGRGGENMTERVPLRAEEPAPVAYTPEDVYIEAPKDTGKRVWIARYEVGQGSGAQVFQSEDAALRYCGRVMLDLNDRVDDATTRQELLDSLGNGKLRDALGLWQMHDTGVLLSVDECAIEA